MVKRGTREWRLGYDILGRPASLSDPSGRLLTLTLDANGGTKTTITWRMLFDTADECAKVRVFAVDANEQNLDRLEAELARMRRAG